MDTAQIESGFVSAIESCPWYFALVGVVIVEGEDGRKVIASSASNLINRLLYVTNSIDDVSLSVYWVYDIYVEEKKMSKKYTSYALLLQ